MIGVTFENAGPGVGVDAPRKAGVALHDDRLGRYGRRKGWWAGWAMIEGERGRAIWGSRDGSVS